MGKIQAIRSTAAWKRARRIVLSEEENCGLCGKPVDKTLPPRTPSSPEVDHKIPLEKGGHPYDRSNLMLVHKYCNQKKADKILTIAEVKKMSESINAERYRGPEDDWSAIFGS